MMTKNMHDSSMTYGSEVKSAMDPELATMIVERYKAALEETADLVAGAPESKLPCDQSLIKEAIKYVLSVTPKDDEAYFDLQVAYSKLGLFIPDKDAEIVRLAEEAVVTMDPTSEGFKYLGKHGKIQQHIQNEMSLLTEELNEFISKQVDE